MIIGAHVMLKSKDDVADKAFLTDILKLSSIDAGEGFLIFGLPPAEVAVHEAEQNGEHELYLMCESIEVFVAEMQRLGVPATPPVNQGWGTLTEVALPGGGTLNVYEPHHARPGGVKGVGAAAKKKAPRRRRRRRAGDPSRRRPRRCRKRKRRLGPRDPQGRPRRLQRRRRSDKPRGGAFEWGASSKPSLVSQVRPDPGPAPSPPSAISSANSASVIRSSSLRCTRASTLSWTCLRSGA